MTPGQLHLFNAGYLVLFIVVAILTRATWRRIGAVTATGAAGGVTSVWCAPGLGVRRSGRVLDCPGFATRADETEAAPFEDLDRSEIC